MYVSVPQVTLRDRVAALYSKVGVVKAGDRVEILERQKKFARVRTPVGQEGWVEQRYLVDQTAFDEVQKMTADALSRPAQGAATARSQTNLHVAPGRDTQHIFQLEDGSKVQLLARATAEKPGAVATIAVKTKPGTKKAAAAEEEKTQPVLEDFWLVRSAQPPNHAGWVLGRMLDADVPLEVAQYSEGQRIVAYFVLNEVQDGDKKVAQYLVALTEPKDGLPFDFNQVRVFTWNVRRHRYETAYRERKLFGMLPIRTGVEDFEKEGRLPFFSFRVQDENGNTAERKYKLNTPIVRRVLGPGEQPVRSARTSSGKSHRRKSK